MTAAIGMVADRNMWLKAAVLVQQLVNVNTTLPIVIFNSTALPEVAPLLLEALGAQVRPLEPAMPVPDSFNSTFLRQRFGTSDAPVLGRVSPWQKLAVWAQTQWSKIVLLDVDMVVLSNIDEMGRFPAQTFSPETCNSIDYVRCAEHNETRTTAGFNAGVMVVGPSESIYESMVEFSRVHIAEPLRAAPNETTAREIEVAYLAYPEQSFLKRFWPSIQFDGAVRGGWDWKWHSGQATESPSGLPTACGRQEQAWPSLASPGSTRTMGTYHRHPPTLDCSPLERPRPRIHFMSRLYNARPLDCATCAPSYIARVKLVHYTCGVKPWAHSMSVWARCAAGQCNRVGSGVGGASCIANWTLIWHEARALVCQRARDMRIHIAGQDCAA